MDTKVTKYSNKRTCLHITQCSESIVRFAVSVPEKNTRNNCSETFFRLFYTARTNLFVQVVFHVPNGLTTLNSISKAIKIPNTQSWFSWKSLA